MGTVIKFNKEVEEENIIMHAQVVEAQQKAVNFKIKMGKQTNKIDEMAKNIQIINRLHQTKLKRKDIAIARVTENIKETRR